MLGGTREQTPISHQGPCIRDISGRRIQNRCLDTVYCNQQGLQCQTDDVEHRCDARGEALELELVIARTSLVRL